MGKKQHQKDKLYLTTTEWRETYGGHKDDTGSRLQRAVFKRLPFSHCALSFLPFEDPVCSPDGCIFDLTHIVPYVKKYGMNPVTGKKLSSKELIPLKFDKDEQGNFRCPVTFKQFTPNTHVVAIRQTGNVYAMEAVQELNVKPAHLKDLLTDEPFQRKDIITLQDPNNLEKFNMENFHHVKLDLKTKSQIAAERQAMQDPKFYIRHMNNETRETLERLKEYVAPEKKEAAEEVLADELNAAHYSQGHVAAGFTSTTMDPITQQKAAILDVETVRYSRVTKNGYIRIVSNFGAINLELYCKQAPRTCENFITHCKRGYYNNTKFHRVIRNFMMQGGDPTGTGKGGESIWGKPFKDEIVQSMSHDQRGVLSMANRGSDTNQSQFFITFRSCKYLDGKHTIFGRVVGGTDTLTAIERLETDPTTSRPLVDVIFMVAEVFVDPFEEAEAAVEKEREEIRLAKAKARKDAAAVSVPATSTQLPKPTVYGSGVGKYLDLNALLNASSSSSSPSPLAKKSRKLGPAEATTTDAVDEGPAVGVGIGVGEVLPTTKKKKKKVVRSELKDFSTW